MNKQILLAVLALGFSATAFAQEMGTPTPIKAGGKCIDCSPAYAAPLVADYDNDGLQDLIVGTWKGEFRFYKNNGSKSEPEYKDFSMIQANGENAVAHNW